jgi:ribonucleotide reductase alpha subunit
MFFTQKAFGLNSAKHAKLFLIADSELKKDNRAMFTPKLEAWEVLVTEIKRYKVTQNNSHTLRGHTWAA